MSDGIFDNAAYSGWLKELTLEPQAPSSEMVQATLRDDQAQRAALANVVLGLERQQPADSLTAPQLIERICDTCRDIATDKTKHLGSDFVKEHFLYHDGMVRRFNGGGLCQVFSPFVLRAGPEETARVLRTCLYEFVTHMVAGLLQLDMFGRDPATPKGRVLIVNGFYRTGSTKVFLAAQAILKFTGRLYTTVGLELSDVDKLIDQVEQGAFAGKWALVKTHWWMPSRPRDGVLTFYTRRNLADVAASDFRRAVVECDRRWAIQFARWSKNQATARRRLGNSRRRKSAPQMSLSREFLVELAHAKRDSNDFAKRIVVQKKAEAKGASFRTVDTLRINQFINDYVAPKCDVRIIDYEDFADRDRELLEVMAREMGISLSPEQLNAAAAFISIERVKEISEGLSEAGDPVTYIQMGHVSATMGRSGGGLKDLPQVIVNELRHFGHWPGVPTPDQPDEPSA